MSWEQAQPTAGPLRFAIFVGEQNVPSGIELDDQDANCVHAVAFDVDNKAIGTGRLLPDGTIGRMAVVKEWRRRGIGVEILTALIDEARKRGHTEAVISAQLQAAEFYREQGFVADGKIQPAGGGLQQPMRKPLGG